MNTDDIRRRLVESETSVLQALGAARALITQLEEENHALRREQARTQIEIFTETEFAKLLKISQTSLRRLRLAGKIKPLLIGELIRYSSADHLEKVGEIFAEQTSSKRLRGRVENILTRRRAG